MGVMCSTNSVSTPTTENHPLALSTNSRQNGCCTFMPVSGVKVPVSGVKVMHYNQGHQSLWDRGTRGPIFGPGEGHYHECPPFDESS